jgi:alpha-tubulin suppressor-like RCC1 family protein
MAAGDNHTCVVMIGGTVKCWGLARQGQLGTGQIVQEERSPVDVIGL